MKVRRGRLFDFYLALARLWLTIERLWPALWPTTAIVGSFVVIALLDLFSYVPGWLHALALLAFAGGLIYTARRAIVSLRPPDEEEARHRIETDSGLVHRPLAALEDAQGTGLNDPKAVALWELHRRRMEQQVQKLALRLPSAGLAKRDPLALRAALVILLVVGVVAAGADAGSRLGRALVPDLRAADAGAGISLDIWVTPPAYTRAAPQLLQWRSGDPQQAKAAPVQPLQVPTGSAVLAQVTGGGKVPKMQIGDTATEFDKVEADAYHIETRIDGGDRLAVNQGGKQIAGWPMTVIPDNRPTVEFTHHPEGTPQLRMSFAFEAEDDYGLQNVKAIIQRADGKAIPGGTDELAIDLPFPGHDRRHVKGRSNHDLTTHVWAGLPVLIHLEATDVHGQTGLSEVLPAVLPERRFNHPVARALVDIRKHMTDDERSRRLTMLKLDNLTEHHELFSNAAGVYLGIRVIHARLEHDPSVQAIVSAQQMMWDIAISLEEGLAALAGRDLMAAEKALREAMDRGADIKELERLMDEVQRALQEFMSALLREFEMRGQKMPLDPDAQILGTEDLKQLLDQAREMMRQGAMEGAKQLMSQLRRMLEDLRSAMAQGRQDPQMREAQRTMSELRDIIRRQQRLLDQSFQNSQEGAEFSEDDAEKSRAEQEALRRKLGEMMQKFNDLLGQVPEQLGNAEQEMRDAEEALGDGRPGDAIGPQTRALEELQKGSQSGGQSLAQRFGLGRQLGLRRGFGPGMGQGFGDLSGPMLRGMRPGQRDPFGRPLEEGGTGTATGTVELPTQSEMQRAREILKELRDRAGDLWRPEFEREYIDRLLKRF